MKLSHADQLILQRFLDRELDPAAAAAFRARLDREPDLREQLERQRALGAGFAAERERRAQAPAGFTAGVLTAARRLPGRRELEAAEQTVGLARTCQRLLLAAAILFGLGLAFAGGLLDGGDSDTVQAAPDEVRREMERLDALIQAGLPEAGSGAKAGVRQEPKQR